MDFRSAFLALALAFAALTGCSTPAASPSPCEATFSARRCTAMAIYAASKLHVSPEQVVAIDVLPPPTPEVRNGITIIHQRSGGLPIDVLVTLDDRTRVRTSMDCGGIPSGAQCLDDPRLQPSTAWDGYRDVPCAGEPPLGCASPLPPPDPEAVAAATELRIDHLDIRIDHVGEYRIAVGDLALPNGILSDASFAIADATPAGLVILSNRIHLALESLEPDGRPFGNIYDHGWRPGIERVRAVLLFKVDAFDPGAVLSVEDVEVR